MKHKIMFTIRQLVFMAICCDLGIVAKKVIGPFSKLVAGYLHVPGGISSAVSITFIIVAAVMVNRFGSATIMSIVQCVISISISGVGRMGAYSVIAYIVPGLAIDIVIYVFHRLRIGRNFKCLFANMIGSLCSALIANILVFGLKSYSLMVYALIALLAGAIAGILAMLLVARLKKILPKESFNIQKDGTRDGE